MKLYKGKIKWISGESEFTPKMIQTKNERVNLVYAVKIGLTNDGDIKIGMPGDVVF
jgi:HlyD family secretion protein